MTNAIIPSSPHKNFAGTGLQPVSKISQANKIYLSSICVKNIKRKKIKNVEISKRKELFSKQFLRCYRN